MNLTFDKEVWENKTLTVNIWKTIIDYIGTYEPISLTVLNFNYNKFNFENHILFPVHYRIGKKLKSFNNEAFILLKKHLEKHYSNLTFSFVSNEISLFTIKIRFSYMTEHEDQIVEAVEEEAYQNKIPSWVTDLDIAQKLINLSKNANKRNIEFAVSFKVLKQLWKLQKCQITGISFVDGIDHLDSKTIDRFDNDKGYIDSNIIICTKRINNAKGDLSLKEITNLAKYAKKKKLI